MIVPSEIRVAVKLREGKTDKRIAHELGIACSTVKKHTENMRTKLGVSNRMQTVLKLTEMGLLP